MAKPVLCYLRRHKWITATNPDGDTYQRCSRCATPTNTGRPTKYADATDPQGTQSLQSQAVSEFVNRYVLRRRRR
jgi:hypothetical protein